MRRVKRLGNVNFTMNSLFVAEEFKPNDLDATRVVSAAHSDIVFVTPNMTPPITLDSKQYGWITDAMRDTLIAMWHNIGIIYPMEYVDGTIVNVQFKYYDSPTFTPLSEGGCFYTAQIPLIQII